jgi:hypothetical protein
MTTPDTREPLTADERARLRELCERATEAPWAWSYIGEKVNGYVIGIGVHLDGTIASGFEEDRDDITDGLLECMEIGNHEAATCNYADPDFIVAARSALPRLLDALGAANERRASDSTQDNLGRVAYQAFSDYCIETGDTVPEHQTPWDELDDWNKQAQIRSARAVSTILESQREADAVRVAWAVRAEIQESMRHTMNEISEQKRISNDALEYRMAYAAAVDCYRAISGPDLAAIVREALAEADGKDDNV